MLWGRFEIKINYEIIPNKPDPPVQPALAMLSVVLEVMRTVLSGTPRAAATAWATLVFMPCPISAPL